MSTFDSNKRLISLDMLRGLTIALMIVVNDPGSWEHIYWPLRHAEWNGVTITDFVFPFFLFIVGVSIVLSTYKQLAAGADKKKMRKKILIRSLKIFALGLLLNLFPEFNFAELRIPRSLAAHRYRLSGLRIDVPLNRLEGAGQDRCRSFWLHTGWPWC